MIENLQSTGYFELKKAYKPQIIDLFLSQKGNILGKNVHDRCQTKQKKNACIYLNFFELPTPNRFLFARHLWAYLNKTANLLKIANAHLWRI